MKEHTSHDGVMRGEKNDMRGWRWVVNLVGDYKQRRLGSFKKYAIRKGKYNKNNNQDVY